MYNNIQISTQNVFQEQFSECIPTKCDFLHKYVIHLFSLLPTHQLCLDIFSFQTHNYEIAIFISVTSRFYMFVLNKNGSSKRMQKKSLLCGNFLCGRKWNVYKFSLLNVTLLCNQNRHCPVQGSQFVSLPKDRTLSNFFCTETVNKMPLS